jgi:uncharacterized protein (DUF433 family)
MPRNRRKILGKFIVADPEICHGQPTFLGTRILVTQVLNQVAKDMPWDRIVQEWRGSITKEAIAEAVELANQAFNDHASEYAAQSSLPP